jgi:osmotically-inducible protein OsmY
VVRLSSSNLQAEVENALLLEGSLDSSGVVATPVGDCVVLRGTVPTLRQRQLAARAAASVRGVTAVRNLLEVNPGSPPRSDAAVAEDCERVLAGLRAETPGRYEVKSASGGVVRLCGEVPTQLQRHQVEEALGSIRGVVRIEDEVRVTVIPEPADVAGRVAATLARSNLVGGAAIEVTRRDRTILLDGIVASAAARAMAEHAAVGAPGVVAVENRTVVAP